MASTRWRINVTASLHGSWGGVATVTMHTTAGGANVCTGGTPSVSNSFSGTPANIFDGDKDTIWIGAPMPFWMEYQFASAVDIVSYSIQADSGPTYTPTAWTLEYYNGSTWVVADTQTGQTAWLAYGVRTYPVLNKMKWRIYVTRTEAAFPPTYVELSEIQFRITASGANQATDIYKAESDLILQSPGRAIDGNTGTVWQVGAAAADKWWQYWFPATTNIIEYVLQAGTNTSFAPKSWTLEYWNGSAWIAVDTRTNQANWTTIESRTFTVTPAATAEGRVSQLPLEVAILSDVPIQMRISQLPIEIVVLTSVAPTVTETTQFFIITG